MKKTLLTLVVATCAAARLQAAVVTVDPEMDRDEMAVITLMPQLTLNTCDHTNHGSFGGLAHLAGSQVPWPKSVGLLSLGIVAFVPRRRARRG